MLREMTLSELNEWIQFAELEPFGEERDDLRAASICSTIANTNRNPKRRAAPYKPSDFLLKFGDRVQRQTAEEQKNIGKFYAALFNSKEEKGKRRMVRPRVNRGSKR